MRQEYVLGKFYSMAPTVIVSWEMMRTDPISVLKKTSGMLVGNVNIEIEQVSFHKRVNLEEHIRQMGGLENALDKTGEKEVE